MSKPDEIDLYRYLLEKGYEEKRVDSFVKNLKKDGLYDLVEEALLASKKLESLVNSLNKFDSSLFGSEDPFSRINLMLSHVLNSMIEDQNYNKRYLFNRRMFLSSTIKQYEQKFQNILKEIDRERKEVLASGLDLLKGKTSEIKKKIDYLLEKMDSMEIEPLEIRQVLLRMESGIDSIFMGEVTPETLSFYIENLPVLISKVNALEERCKILFSKKEELEENIRRVKEVFDELEKVSDRASRAGIKLSHIEEYLKWKDLLISRIREKCKKAGPECYDNAIASAKELYDELSHLLKQSASIGSLLERRIELLDLLKSVEEKAERLDSMIKSDFFSKSVGRLKKDLDTISGIESIMESSDLEKFVDQAESLMMEIKLLDELSKAVEEIEKIPSDERKSKNFRTMLGKLIETLNSNVPLRDKVPRVKALIKELVKGARATRDVLQDLLRLYPIWRRRILSLVRERGSLSLEELEFVPPRWRKWVVDRIVKEVGDISLSGNRLILSGALSPVSVSIEVARQKTAAFEELLRGLEEFLGTELMEERKGLERVKNMINSIERSAVEGEDGKHVEEALIEVNRALQVLANMLRERMVR